MTRADGERRALYLRSLLSALLTGLILAVLEVSLNP